MPNQFYHVRRLNVSPLIRKFYPVKIGGAIARRKSKCGSPLQMLAAQYLHCMHFECIDTERFSNLSQHTIFVDGSIAMQQNQPNEMNIVKFRQEK